jgi:tetratricopeptide (TPR) repeat protein
MSHVVPSRSGKPWPWVGLVALILMGGGVAWWLIWPKTPPIDPIGSLHANTRGIGFMEQLEYDKAVEAFAEAVRLNPPWLPARINQGIALLHTNTRENHQTATAIFEDVLREEPTNPYAHFCLGLIFQDSQLDDAAAAHFDSVTHIDPNDATSWYLLGCLRADRTLRRDCLERAIHLDPYLSAAAYALASDLQQDDPRRARAYLAEYGALSHSNWDNPISGSYGQRGRYATVIDPVADAQSAPRIGPIPLFAPDEKFHVRLAAGARWATAADFGQGTVADLRRGLRERMGATMVVLDYNRDGRPDLFLLGAVVEGGKVRDLLLRNDGQGIFTDVTAEAGLVSDQPSLGCCVADFDNDTYPDLFITGAGQQRLYRNAAVDSKDPTRGRHFVDVTAQAGLDQLKTVCLSAAFLDLDQDGDLDLVVAQYAATPEQALAILHSDKPTRGAGLAVYLNVGERPPQDSGEDHPRPLKPCFKPLTEPTALSQNDGPVTGIVMSDLDGDGDLDLLILADRAAPTPILNDRLLRFHRGKLPSTLAPAAAWNGGLVLDVNGDGKFDLFLLPDGQKPILLLNRTAAYQSTAGPVFEKGATDSPPLLQAQAVDLDLDGHTDVVGLSERHKPVLLHNDGHRLVHALEKLGRDADWPNDLVAVAVADFNNDCYPDLLVWSEATGLHLYLNHKNGNHGMFVDLTGYHHWEGTLLPTRCNADAVGAVVRAQVGDQGSWVENTTLSAGLGQSRPTLILGMGAATEPDVIRLRWPDLVWHAEFPFGVPCRIRIGEPIRITDSCPVLFAWDGRRYRFVTDFLGAGSMGESQPDRTCRPPRPEESVKIEADQLVPRNGEYVLKVAQPMDEVVYLDRLQLTVLDHPADVQVYPDERFVSSGPPASQDLLALGQPIEPVSARDHHGRDVTQTLRCWDRLTVDGFARRSWLGYAEEHWVELDFGDRLAKFGPHDPLVLCLAGWTEYPYPESIWAATQAGIRLLPPVLEKCGADGKWQTIVADTGLPAGLPRMMTLDVTGRLAGPACRIRLRTNMTIYWDQIYIAPLRQRTPASAVSRDGNKPGIYRATMFDVSAATLEVCGCAQEYTPDGRRPSIYDHDRHEAVPLTHWSGHLTRLGDVTELLQERDDRFVIFGPGEEVTVRFDARGLPALPAGWRRSFVLRAWGYSKDNGPFTATGGTVEPLPFQGMSRYPYGPEEHYPRDPFHEEYRWRYNTRAVGAARTREQPHEDHR